MNPAPPAPAWKTGGIPASIREAPSAKRPRPGKKSQGPHTRFSPPKDLSVHLARAHPILNTSIALPRSSVQHCLRVEYGKLFPYADKPIIELATKTFSSAGFIDFKLFKGYFDIGFPSNDLAAAAAETPLVFKNTPIPTTRTRLPTDNTLVVKFSNLPSFLDPKILHQELVQGLQEYGTNVVVDFITPQGARHLAAPRAIATLTPTISNVNQLIPPRATIPAAPLHVFWARTEAGRLVCSHCLDIDHLVAKCPIFISEKCTTPQPIPNGNGAPLDTPNTPFSKWGTILPPPPKPSPAAKKAPEAANRRGRSTGSAGSITGTASDPASSKVGGSDPPYMQRTSTQPRNANACSNGEPIGEIMHDAGAHETSSMTLHGPALPPQSICIVENPHSSIPKQDFTIRVGNPWEIFREIGKDMLELSDEAQSAIPIEKFLDTSLLNTITQRFMPDPNEEFVSSHQIAANLVKGKTSKKMDELVLVHAKTLAQGVHPPVLPKDFPRVITEAIIAQHETTNQAVLMVAEAFDPSHQAHKFLISRRLAAEQAMVKYMELLHKVNLYGTTCDPIQYEWPHVADYPTPLLSTLERMCYDEYNVNPYDPFPDESSNSEMSG